ncbi:hypothetical protein P3T33_004754 [Rhizobium sp. AN67]|nr:hypothetical protein [Rhizobium sp. AN67]SOD50580.1 hypothetical protein SAMN05216595_0246 [Rhizobium sp. AN6A]
MGRPDFQERVVHTETARKVALKLNVKLTFLVWTTARAVYFSGVNK